ncbi:hypothetical protein BCR43DRAFT_516497 [Syncephalastrum racemosum]|uniref:Uncharacterized protein n=1 Tax=Syncephalastrum racemosum TaxID=13706 RepID=A0A1X2H8J8_SYNRA|nr:hypothetical protein BCR43DRAFT_516497 [Syncephalastrum racemosum]
MDRLVLRFFGWCFKQELVLRDGTPDDYQVEFVLYTDSIREQALICTCPARTLREDHVEVPPGGGVIQVDVMGILSRRGDQYGLELLSIRILENVADALQLRAVSRNMAQQRTDRIHRDISRMVTPEQVASDQQAFAEQNAVQEGLQQGALESYIDRRLTALESTMNSRLDAIDAGMLRAIHTGFEIATNSMANTVANTVTDRINARFNFLRNDFYELRNHIDEQYFDEYIDDLATDVDDETDDTGESNDDDREDLQEELRELNDDLGHGRTELAHIKRKEEEEDEETEDDSASYASCKDYRHGDTPL